jgi:hypothetical protein
VHGGNSRFEFASETGRDRYFHNSARLLPAGYNLVFHDCCLISVRPGAGGRSGNCWLASPFCRHCLARIKTDFSGLLGANGV